MSARLPGSPARERALARALDAVIDGTLYDWLATPPRSSDAVWDDGLAALLRVLALDWPGGTQAARAVSASAEDRAARLLLAATAAWGASGDPGPDTPDAVAALLEVTAPFAPDDLDDPLLRFGLYVAVEAFMAHARLDLSRRLADRLGSRLYEPLRLVGVQGSHRFSTVLVVCRARVLAFAGEIDEAGRVLEAASEPAPGMLSALQAAVACLVKASNAERAALLAMVAEVDRHIVDLGTHLHTGTHMLAAYGLISLGELEVQEAARRVLAGGGDADLSRLNVIDRALGLETLVALAVAEHDLDAAEAWAQRAAPLLISPIADSTVLRSFSRVALLAGRAEEAVGWAERAVARARECDRFIEYAEGEIVLNRARLALEPESSDSVVAALEAMVAAAERLGMRQSRKAATRELRPVGRRLRPIATSGWAGLSPREALVARAVADGGTNRQIAQRLGVSEHTVRAHVSRVLAAFGVATRSGLPAAIGTDEPAAGGPGARPALTARQDEVAGLIARGLSNQAIAGRLGVSVRTVEKHVGDILVRWDLARRTDIARVVAGGRPVAGG